MSHDEDQRISDATDRSCLIVLGLVLLVIILGGLMGWLTARGL